MRGVLTSGCPVIESCASNRSTGFIESCFSRIFGFVLFVWQENLPPHPATRLENKTRASGAMSADAPPLRSCWPLPPQPHHHLHHHHVSGWQPTRAARQDPLPEQVHREFQEERGGSGVPVLCPQRGVLQNLQGFLVQLLHLIRTNCGRLHHRKNTHLRLWKSTPNATHEEIMQVQHWTKERDMYPYNRGRISQQPGPLG